MPSLSDLATAAGVGGSVASGILGANAVGNATNALTTGATQGINTVSQGQEQALQALIAALQQQEALYGPQVAAGQSATNTLAAGTQPGGALVQPFSFNPQNVANDPGYQFELEQGESAINAAGAANGERFSGSTLKNLDNYATGEAATFENQDYQQQFNNYQYNQQTQLNALQNMASLGENAAATEGGQLGQYGSNVSNVDTSTAAAIANLEAQLANAKAAGDIGTANSIQNTISGITGALGQGAVLNSLGSGSSGANSTTTMFDSSGNAYQVPNAQVSAMQSQGLSTTAPSGGQVGGTGAGTGGTPTLNVNPNSTTTMYGPNGQPTEVPTSQAQQYQQQGYSYQPPGDTVENLPGSIGTVAGAGGAGVGAAAAGAGSAAVPAGTATVTIPGVTDAAGAAAGAGEATGATAADLGAAGADAGAGAATDAGVDAGVTAATDAGVDAGTSGLLSSVAGLLTNPWTIGIGGAIIGIGALVEALQVHPVANEFVQQYQNPFGQQLGTLVDGFDNAFKSGNLTQDQAQTIYTNTQQAIDSFMQAGDNFAKQGGKEQTVWNQAQRTMAQDFGGSQNANGTWTPDWSLILGKMQNEIAGMSPSTPTPAAAG